MDTPLNTIHTTLFAIKKQQKNKKKEKSKKVNV